MPIHLLFARECGGFADRGCGPALAHKVGMGKYAVAWLLGVPLSVLVVIYLVSHTVCG
jgi:hypothetical protein